MLAFIIWFAISSIFIILGLYLWNTKRDSALGFWANAEMFPVNDVKAYHRAMGKLWIVFGVVLACTGRNKGEVQWLKR